MIKIVIVYESICDVHQLVDRPKERTERSTVELNTLKCNVLPQGGSRYVCHDIEPVCDVLADHENCRI